MEVQSPKSKTGKRRYVRQRPYVKTPARVAAYMANFEKMVGAPKEKRYPPSPKRDAANMKNLGKAWATPRKPSAVRVEQEKLSERLASLFPAYPPKETGFRDSGLGAREPELGDSGRDAEPKSGIPNPELRTPDPGPEGVGTKPECDVESADNCPTSPSRIQHDAGIGDSEFGAREPELGDSGRDPEPKSGIPNPEPRTPDPASGGVGTKPECDVESTDNCPTSPSRIQHDAGIGDSEFGDRESDWGGPRQDDDDDGESESRTPDPAFGHQDKPQPGADATSTDDQPATGNPQSAIPEPRTPDPDPGGVGTKPECDVESIDNCPTSPSRIQHDAGMGDSELGDGESDWGGVRKDDDDDGESESRTPDPAFGHQEKPQSGADATATDDQSATGSRQSASPDPQNPNLLLPDSATALRTVAERIWKRRRHFPRQARREGRQVMRLLTQAAQSPAPGSQQEAYKLFLQLLEILQPTRVLRQAQNLNESIERALIEMLEARYGREAFINGEPVASLFRAVEADYKRQMAEEKAEREARRAARQQATGNGGQGTEDSGQGTGDRKQGTESKQEAAEAAQESGTEANDASTANTGEASPEQKAAEQPRGRGPQLPKTFEEFWGLFSRAFRPPQEVREVDHDRMLLRPVAESVWARLHVYERQEQQENERLDAALQKADQPVGNLNDLRRRAWAVLAAFRVESWFTDALRELQTDLDQDIGQLVKWRYGPAVYREVTPPPPRRRTPVTSNK